MKNLSLIKYSPIQNQKIELLFEKKLPVELIGHKKIKKGTLKKNLFKNDIFLL